jgi:hypothetical protein
MRKGKIINMLKFCGKVETGCFSGCIPENGHIHPKYALDSRKKNSQYSENHRIKNREGTIASLPVS